MNDSQFRVLYRQFLFRMVDLELLSADAKGDMGKLFGQFAALLIFISLALCVGAGLASGGLVPEWSGVHFMIATTMLTVGLFAIMSWDSTFPDRRDVMVLATLPIRTRTVFFAKIAAVATALGVTIATLHSLAGFVWPLSLNTHHESAIAPTIAYQSAMPPLTPSALGPVLKQDLKGALRADGATVGVWKHGEQRVYAYGTAKPDSIFEIGSVTKTFTALALAQMVVEGKVTLNEPVRDLLPPDTVPLSNYEEMTLRDLATHRSGLPMWPNTLHPTDPHNFLSFPEWGTPELYAFMQGWGVGKMPWTGFSYSNLGFGLLGQTLENRAAADYAELVSRITGPLGMHDTVVNLSPEQQQRVLQGYSAPNVPVGGAEIGALAGAGALRSTAPDMLRYLAANLHPEKLPPANDLPAAMKLQQKLQAQLGSGMSIALSWIYDANARIYSHDGATVGYTCDAFFSPDNDYAVIVLTNSGPDLFQFASVLGQHVGEQLTGERAISLNATVIPAGGGGFFDFFRTFAAWWITMLLAGAFIYCCVLGAQGIAAELLPRRQFLRISSWMQLGAFGIFVAAYFLEPKIITPAALVVPQGSAYLEWSPSYWFLGLYQQLNGSPALPELAKRAWIAIPIAFGVTALAYTLAYFRTMRRIVEEPDIAPAIGGRNWLPRFGNGFTTAIGQFTVRTMARSRQHRLLLSLYLGVGFAAAIIYRKGDESAHTPIHLGPLCSSILIMLLCIIGIRVVFSLPMDLRANWIFRMTPYPSGAGCMIARRRALYVLSVVPVCLATAALLFPVWPWQVAAKHVAVLIFLGIATAEVCLHGIQKLPFTCSYLPGKSNFNISFLLAGTLVFTLIVEAAKLERDSFDDWPEYAAIAGVLLILAIAARWSATRLAKSPEGDLQFEDAANPAVFALDLHRDGVTPISSAVTDK